MKAHLLFWRNDRHGSQVSDPLKTHVVTKMEGIVALLLAHNPRLCNVHSKEVVSDSLPVRAALAMAADLRIGANAARDPLGNQVVAGVLANDGGYR